MDPEEGAAPGGNRRIWIMIAIAGAVAVVAYLYFRSKSGGGSPSTAGGGGTITSGSTTLEKGAVAITVTQNPQPTPPVKGKTTHTGSTQGPQPVSRVDRSPFVRHKIHQINAHHDATADKTSGKKAKK